VTESLKHSEVSTIFLPENGTRRIEHCLETELHEIFSRFGLRDHLSF
jgi:hypothetical protein